MVLLHERLRSAGHRSTAINNWYTTRPKTTQQSQQRARSENQPRLLVCYGPLANITWLCAATGARSRPLSPCKSLAVLPATTAKPQNRNRQRRRRRRDEPLVARRCSSTRRHHGRRCAPNASAGPVGPHGRLVRGRPRAALRARRAAAGAVPEPAAAARAHGKLCRRRPVAARKHCNKEKETVTRT